MKKRFTLISMILCFTLAFCGCSRTQGNGKDDSGNTPNSTEDIITQDKLSVIRPSAYGNVNGLSLEPGSSISIIGRYSGDSYWKQVEEGAKKAIENLNSILGYKGNDKIKLSFNAPETRDDVNEQVNILDEEVNRNPVPVAICIAPIDASACSIQFDMAAENGIPIITFDSGSDYQHIVSHISTNNVEAAKTAASKLAYVVEETGEVAVFVQDSVSTTAKQRLQGFTQTITSEFPQVSIVNVYHMDQLDTVRQTIAAEKNAALPEGSEPINPKDISQEDVVTYILEKYPNLKGIFATNLDTTQLVAGVLKDLERTDLKFVGFDGGAEQMQLLDDEILEGLIIQNPYGMGYAAVVASARVSLDLGNDSSVDCGYTWVTKENMENTDIKAMLY